MNFEWSDALFLPEDEVWNKDTKGMVLDPNDVEDDDLVEAFLYYYDNDAYIEIKNG